jgi:SAM-dependent methyltransferase
MNHDPQETNINSRVWEDVYKQGKSNLNYPNSFLVSLSHHLFNPAKQRRVLDYGFGTGANLISLAHRGFEVSGVEVSETAVEIVNAKLKAQNLKADLRITSNNRIPHDDGFFDIVVAWQVLYYNTWETLRPAVKEIDRVLRPGGIFLGTMAAPGDASHLHSKPLGNSVYVSNIAGQEGATLLIVDKDQLPQIFSKKSLKTGQFIQSFEGLATNSHWVVSYEK